MPTVGLFDSRSASQLVVEPPERKSMNFDELILETDDEVVTTALMTPNEFGNTPLFDALQREKKYPSPMLDRVSQLPKEDKEKILFAKNTSGKTLAHAIIYFNPSDEKHFIKSFGLDLVKKAMIQQDDNGNTPIQNALSTLILNAKRIATHFQQLEYKNDDNIVELFNPNHSSRNVFHIVCARKVSVRNHQLGDTANNNVEILRAVFSVLPQRFHLPRLMAQDSNKQTPLHLAIERNSSFIIEEIFKQLSPQERQKMALITDAWHYTALHSACRFGNPKILQLVFAALGHAETSRIYLESTPIIFDSGLKKLVENNIQFLKWSDFEEQVLTHISLFNCFNYFSSYFQTSMLPSEQNFNLRFDDFAACFRAIKRGIELPIPSEKLDSGLYARYYNLRAHLKNMTLHDIEEFEKHVIETAAKPKQFTRKGDQVKDSVWVAQQLVEKLELTQKSRAVVTPAVCSNPLLIGYYEELKSYHKNGMKPDILTKHISDFCSCLEARRRGLNLPSYEGTHLFMQQFYTASKFFKTNNRYYEFVDDLQRKINPHDIEAFEKFIESCVKDSEIAKLIHSKMKEYNRVNTEFLIPVALPKRDEAVVVARVGGV